MPGNKRIRILIVENNHYWRDIQQRNLISWGYQPIIAEGIGHDLIADAVRKSKEFRCQIAIVDMRLFDDENSQDMTGLEVAQRISPTKTIIVSADNNRDRAIIVMKTPGVSDFIGKDSERDVLKNSLSKMIEDISIGDKGTHLIWPEKLSSSTVQELLLPPDLNTPDDEAEEVIQRLFPRSKIVVLNPINDIEDVSNRTSALRRRSRVFQASIDDQVRQQVVKLASVKKIQQEIENHRLYVDRWLRGNFHPRIEAESVLWDIGAISYTYVGDLDFGPHSSTQTLTMTYRSANRIEDILVPLRKFFKQIWSYWYTNRIDSLTNSLFTAYDIGWDGALSAALPSWSRFKETRPFQGVPAALVDPRWWLAHRHQECLQVHNPRIAVTHGDLHGDNLFVDTQNAWPIDFERTGPGPILRDFVELIQDLVTRAAQFDLADLPVFYELAVAICAPTRPDQPMQTTPAIEDHPEARKAFAVVQDLQLLAARRTQYTDRREYLWGLLLNSLFVVRLLDQEQDATRREITLLLAAVICDRLARWGNRNWRPKDSPPLTWITPKEPPMPTPNSAQPVPSSEAKAPGFRHGYALLVGVGADLPATVRDATLMRDILTDPQRCAYPTTQVRLLTEARATRRAVLDGLDWLTAQVQADPQATVVLYFSGHGIAAPDFHLMTHGYSMGALANTTVSGAELNDRLRAMRPNQLLVLLDCCHAGGMADIKDPGVTAKAVPPELSSELAAGSGRVLLASSHDHEKSLVIGDYSAFTRALYQAMAGHGAQNYDGYARVTDIALYVSRMVTQWTKDRQHPVLDIARSDNFAVAYYAGGSKEPQPLVGELAASVPTINAITLQGTNGQQRFDTATLRGKLRQMNNDEFAEFLQDHFPEVGQALSDGQSRAQKQTYLLDYCARKPEQGRRLMDALL